MLVNIQDHDHMGFHTVSFCRQLPILWIYLLPPPSTHRMDVTRLSKSLWNLSTKLRGSRCQWSYIHLLLQVSYEMLFIVYA